MSLWSHIYGMVIYTVPLLDNNSITSYDEAINALKKQFGPFKRCFDDVKDEDVTLPKGSEGSIEYYFTDMTDHNQNKTLSEKYFTKELQIGIIFRGDLRDYIDERKLKEWVFSIDNIMYDDYRLILKDGLFTIEGFSNSDTLYYSMDGWDEKDWHN